MRDRNQLSQTDAERQLAWSRSYLRREKRLRLLRRIVPLVLVAAVCTVGVYACPRGPWALRRLRLLQHPRPRQHPYRRRPAARPTTP